MAGRLRSHPTAVATATRYSPWKRMAPTRAWSRIRKAVEQRRDGLLTATRSILPIASRKITGPIVKSFRPHCESSEWDERDGRKSREGSGERTGKASEDNGAKRDERPASAAATSWQA